MKRKGQLEFDSELIVPVGFGVIAGFLAVFIMKSSGLGFFWKIATFIATTIATAFLTMKIFDSG